MRHRILIQRLRSKGRERGWCCSPEQKLPRRWLTELAKFGRSGVESSGLWPGMEYAACVIHLGLVREAGRLRTKCAKAVAGLHGGGTTASAVSASERVHGPLTLAHNDREGAGVLTEGSRLAGRDAAAPAARSGRWSRAALAEESKEGVSRRLSSTAGCGVVLRGWTVGQGGRRWAGGEELR